MITYNDAWDQTIAPGTPFEMAEWVDERGVVNEIFINAPSTLREIYNQARANGDATALVYGDLRLSFAKTIEMADSFGAALVHEFGIKPGDRVAIAMRNHPEWIVAFIAITSIGAMCVPLNSWWKKDELDFAIEDCGATLVVADIARAKFIEEVAQSREIPIVIAGETPGEIEIAGSTYNLEQFFSARTLPEIQLNADDDAILLYTSGTTGKPKGAVSTHRAIIQSIWAAAAIDAIETIRLGDSLPPTPHDPASLLGIPLFHVTGLVSVTLASLLGDQKLVLMNRWDPEVALQLIEKERINVFIGVPTQIFDLVNHPNFAEFDTSSVQWIGGGGAATPPALLTQIKEQFENAAPAFGYGMTETNALGPTISGEDAYLNPDTIGRSAPGMVVSIHNPDTLEELPIGEDGEIWLRGATLTRGYWNRPDDTARLFHDGWLRTGDVGHIDSNGLVYVSDRIKDVIIRGGENVYSAEVEAVLYEHPDVLEAAVFGVKHPRLGDEVATAVVLRPGASVTEDELTDFMRPKLAAFKIPTIFHLRDESLPRNPSGKFLKTKLRESYYE